MDIISMKYFYELCKNMNITKTSKKLYVTQQTLSNHIMRLEEFYSTKFFYRKPKLKLTESGLIFLDYVKKILEIEENIKAKIEDIEQEAIGTIVVGASSPRCNSYIPKILSKFSKKYPNVKIKLVDEYSNVLEKLVIENEIDFAILIGEVKNNSELIVEKIIDDKVFFLVSNLLLKKFYPKKVEELKEENFNGTKLKRFKKLPYLTIPSTNRLGKIIDSCFKEANFLPTSYIETKYTSMLVPLCNSALVAGFTSQMNLNLWKKELENHVNVFPLFSNDEQVKITVNLIRNKNRYLPRYSIFFIEILKKYLMEIEFLDFRRKA